jgi:hypothetical protein
MALTITQANDVNALLRFAFGTEEDSKSIGYDRFTEAVGNLAESANKVLHAGFTREAIVARLDDLSRDDS